MGHGIGCKCEKLENRGGGSRMDLTKLGVSAFRGGMVGVRCRAIRTESTKDENEVGIGTYRGLHCGCRDCAIDSPWLKMTVI